MSRSAPLRRYRFTTPEYFRMAEAGIFPEDARVELLDGEIVEMSPTGNRHASLVSRLNALFAPALAGQAIVRVQDPIVLGDTSAPQPDIAVVRYRTDFYEPSHPAADDVLLLVEVSDSSFRIDVGLKSRLYARASIEEYWVVDVERRQVLVHTQPAPDGYGVVRRARAPGVLTPSTLPNHAFDLAALLGTASA